MHACAREVEGGAEKFKENKSATESQGKNERSTSEREQTSGLGKRASEQASEQAREREGEREHSFPTTVAG